MSASRPPIVRCAEPACPYLGFWPSGYCPEHVPEHPLHFDLDRQEGTDS